MPPPYPIFGFTYRWSSTTETQPSVISQQIGKGVSYTENRFKINRSADTQSIQCITQSIEPIESFIRDRRGRPFHLLNVPVKLFRCTKYSKVLNGEPGGDDLYTVSLSLMQVFRP